MLCMILANVVHLILKQLDFTTSFQVSNIFIAYEGESRTFLKSCKDTGTLTDTHGLADDLVTVYNPMGSEGVCRIANEV